jgi:hypothetical protein
MGFDGSEIDGRPVGDAVNRGTCHGVAALVVDRAGRLTAVVPRPARGRGKRLTLQRRLGQTEIASSVPDVEEDHDHGKGLYVALVPWVVFTLLAQHSTLRLPAVSPSADQRSTP